MFIQGIIVRGTTAIHEFSTSYSPSDIEELRIVYGQNRRAVIIKDQYAARITKDNITLNLSQEDTLLFTPGKNITVEIKIKLTNGQVVSNAREPIYLAVADSLIEEVLE